MSVARQPIVLVGAGGHAKVLADQCLRSGYQIKGYISPEINEGMGLFGIPYLGKDEMLSSLIAKGAVRFCIAVGDQAHRRRIAEHLDTLGGDVVTLQDPTAIVSGFAVIGQGAQILVGAIINAAAEVGPHCLINTGASVDHDVKLGAFVQISPQVALAGGVICGEGTFIGTGAVVIPNVRIGANAVIGAGAVVVRDVPDGITVVGAPARPISRI